MNKRVKLCLALFLAFAVIVQYSFSPQAMIAYGEDGGTVAATEASDQAAEKPAPEPTQATTAPKPAPEPSTSSDSSGSSDSSASSDSSDATEPTESTEASDDSDGSGDDANTDAEDPTTVEEETVVDEEEAEEEGYPAQDFSGSANGVSVSVSAPKGALPEGTKMSVSGVSAGQVQAAVEGLVDGEVANLKAVDISFRCDGKEIEPKKAVSVHMTASGVEADKVVHIADSGSANVVSASTSGSSASFKSDEFSVYIVVEEEDPSADINAVATYEFYVGKDLKGSQNIKSGDTLLDPGTLGAGDGATSIFKGWFVAEDQTITGETPGSKLTFGKRSAVPKTETIKVVAKIETTYYVTFLGEKIDDARAVVAVDTVTVDGPSGTEGTLDISSRSVIPKADTSAFEGWSETDGGELITDTTITVTENKTLYASVVNAHWIRFDENVDYATSDSDPTYTGPVFVKNNDDLSTKKPADPKRPGYSFGGWYKDEDCTEAFAWTGTGLKEDITLYAKWIPGKAKYTVIIWKQKVTDKKDAADDAKTYDFEASEQLTGTTGETLSADDFTSYTTHEYTGFHYSKRIVIEPETVRADGTTVVNVYYDRNLLTIRFIDGTHTVYEETTSDYGQQYGLVDGEYISLSRENEGSYWYPDYHYYYQAQNAYSGTTYRQASGTSGTQYGFVGGQMVRLERRNGNWYANGNRYYGTRYFEGAQGNSGYGVVGGAVVGISHNDEGWFYTTSKEYTETRYIAAQEPDVTEYTGLYGSTLESNKYEWPSDRAWYQNPNGGGTRLTFLDAFKFEGLSGVSEGNTILTQYGANPSGNNTIRFYKQNINGSWPTTATNTVTTTAGATFTITEKYEGFKAVSYSNGSGWSNTQAGSSVSSTNLSIRFERQKYTLTFVSEGTTVGTKTGIPYEDVLEGYKIADPTKEHYNFVGWCEDPEGVALFDWSSKMPAANKVLYAKWEPKQYHVSLKANGGTLPAGQDAEFNVPLDTVLSKASLMLTTWDNKHELVGWFYRNEDGSAGNVYDFGKIESDVNLIAKWRMPGQVSIIYDAGEGGTLDGQPDKYKYATDSAVVLAAPPTVKEGFIFVGWKLEDSKGTLLDTVYYPGNTFDITEDIIQKYVEATKTGEIHVVAVYNKTNEGPFEKTYIRWFKNDGSECFHTDTLESPTGDVDDSTLLVNEPVSIQTVPEREGYEFLGWAKVPEADDLELEQDLDEDDILIFYKDGKFYSDKACKKEATEVAADNDRKYEAMFAVWKCKTYTVTWKTQDGKTELEKDTGVAYNTQPSFGGTVPQKPEDAYYTYSFAGWATSENQESGTEASSLPTVKKNVTYYAAYSKTEKTVTINYVATTGGTVDPETETVGLATGTVQGSTATPTDGYKFVNWTDGNNTEVSTNAKYVPEKKAATYTAHFEQIIEPQTVTVEIKTTSKTATYNGKQQENGYTVTYKIGEATYSELPEGLTAKISGGAAKGTDKGNYTSSVTVTVGVDEAHSAMYDVTEATDSADIKLTINPAPASIMAENKSKIFGEADPKLTAQKKGFFGSDTVEYTLSREAGEAVGKYVITVSIPGAESVQSSAAEVSAMAASKTVAVGNYNITLVDGTFTITAPTADDVTPTPTPTPTPDNNPGGGNAITTVLPAAAPIVDTPAPTTIDEPAPPKAVNAYWALINLLCAIATALLSLIMLIRYFGKRKEEEELTDPATGERVTRDVDEQRGGLARIASLIPAIGGIIAFILTEDMSLPMAMVDKWTVLMIVILAIQVGVGIVAKLRDEKDDEDEEAMA